MDIRTLRYFISVSEERSLTVAAGKLGISQPALSKSMKELETEMGLQLFVRNSRGTALTEAGRVLYDRAREIIEMTDRVVSEIRSTNQNRGCSVNIGLGESPDIDFISDSFSRILDELPESRINLYSDNLEGIRSKLEMGFIDIAVILGPVDRNIYEGFSTGHETCYGILMREDDPLIELESIGRDNLRGRAIVGLRGSDHHVGLDDMFGDIFERQSVASYNLINNAASMVRKGVGVAVTLEWLYNRIDNSGLRFVPLRPTMVVDTSIVWLKNRRLSVSAAALVDDLRRSYGRK